MKYKVEFTKSAIKDLKKIDKKDSTKIAAWIKKNLVDCENPRRYGKVSSSQFIRDAVMEKIEDSYDLAAYETAMKEFEEDKTTYSFDEAMEELGIEI